MASSGPAARLCWMEAYMGMTKEQLRKVVLKQPKSLSNSIEVSIMPVVAFLTEELGLSLPQVVTIILKFPEVIFKHCRFFFSFELGESSLWSILFAMECHHLPALSSRLLSLIIHAQPVGVTISPENASYNLTQLSTLRGLTEIRLLSFPPYLPPSIPPSASKPV